MITIKKLSLICLSLCLCMCALCACGETGANAYATYSGGEAKTDSLTNYSAVMTQTIAVELGGEDGDFTINARTVIEADFADATSPVSLNKSVIERDGELVADTTLYHENGMTYYNDQSAKYKAARSNEEVLATLQKVAGFGFPESVFDDAKASKGADGAVTISATADDGELSPFAEQFISSVGELADDKQYALSDVKLTITVNADGYLSDVVCKYTATFLSDGTDARADVVLSFVYNEPGKQVKITPPEGLDTYPTYEEYISSSPETDTPSDTDPSSEPSDSGDEFITEQQGEAIDAAFAMFDENYNPVENYDELYAQACEKYGKEMMDSIIETIVMFSSMN